MNGTEVPDPQLEQSDEPQASGTEPEKSGFFCLGFAVAAVLLVIGVIALFTYRPDVPAMLARLDIHRRFSVVIDEAGAPMYRSWYSGPYDHIGTLPHGDRVEVLVERQADSPLEGGRKELWLYVRWGRTVGWVSGEFISPPR